MLQYDFFKLANLDNCKKVSIDESNTKNLGKSMIYDLNYGITLVEFISSNTEMFLKCTYKKKDQEFDVEDVYLLDDRTWKDVLHHVLASQISDDYTFEVLPNGC